MEVTARNVDRLQHVAVSRLTLFVAGEIHALIEPFQRWLGDQVRQAATDDGAADVAKLAGLMLIVEPRWAEVMRQYASLLRAARVQAADVGFTSLRVKNNARFTEWVTRGEEENGQRLMVNGQRSMVNGPAGGPPGGAVVLEETFRPDSTDWIRLARMWMQRRNAALAVAQQRVLGDGLTLSTRIWRLEAGGLQAIRQTVAAGMAKRTSAWELAQRLEGQLGANADFPRWTRQRLHALSPRERAQDLSGLLRAGDVLQPWQSRGVSYNALRLARTEIQYANHAVTSEIARNFPGIVGRKSRLSPEHPVTDICDEYAAGGPYGPEADFLPLHPQCVTPGQTVETDRGAVRIEDVRVGDMVLTHVGRMRPVTAVWEQNHSGPVYEICTDGGRFEVTGNHPVLLSRGWVNAEGVQPGDQVLYMGGLYDYTPVRLIRTSQHDGPVHNLTVADDHSYVVNGHAVHNCLCYWEEVLMPKAEFVAQVRGWAAGENDFLDGYAAWLDQRAMGPWVEAAALAGFWNVLALWMGGDVDAMAVVLKM